MWKFFSSATTRTVSSFPGSGIIGSLQTEQRGAYFLQHRTMEETMTTMVTFKGGFSVLFSGISSTEITNV